MIAAGETTSRWMSSGGCWRFVARCWLPHFLLGKVAVEVNNDIPLGRGHFGAGYQLGLQAWRRAGQPIPVAALHPANRVFFDCGRGLAWCLHNLQMTPLAIEVVEQMLALDPSDPLALNGWLDEMRTEGKQIVELGGLLFKAGLANSRGPETWRVLR